MRFFKWLKRHRAGLITAIGYATVTVIAIAVFVYLMFPWQKLSRWIQGKIERGMAIEISIQESRLRFPFHLVWKGVTVTPVGRPGQARMTAEQVSMAWPIAAVLHRQLDLDLSVQALGGEVNGRLMVRRADLGTRYHFKGQGRDLNLEKIAAVFQFPSEDLGGAVQISRIEHDWMDQDWKRGEGGMALEAIGVEHRRWNVQFTRLNGAVTFKGGMSNLKNFSAQGPAMDLVGSGSLLLRPDVMDSLLDFNARVTLRKPAGPLMWLMAFASRDGHLDFALRGVLKHPTPYVNGAPFSPIGTGASDVSLKTERAGEPPRRSSVGPDGP